MPLTGNKGEWSEIYVFLRLLAMGKLFAADADLNKIGGTFYNILNVLRTENGQKLEFRVDRSAGSVSVVNSDTNATLTSLPFGAFWEECKSPSPAYSPLRRCRYPGAGCRFPSPGGRCVPPLPPGPRRKYSRSLHRSAPPRHAPAFPPGSRSAGHLPRSDRFSWQLLLFFLLFVEYTIKSQKKQAQILHSSPCDSAEYGELLSAQ